LLADLGDAAKNDVLDPVAGDSGPFQGGVQNVGRQVHGVDSGEAPLPLAAGSADGIDDQRLGHVGEDTTGLTRKSTGDPRFTRPGGRALDRSSPRGGQEADRRQWPRRWGAPWLQPRGGDAPAAAPRGPARRAGPWASTRATPSAAPTPTGLSPLERTRPTSCRCRAPRAARMPSSRRRRRTHWLTTP